MSSIHGAKLIRVDRRNPCSICGHTDWCGYSVDGEMVVCMRVPDGALKSTKDKAGWIHLLTEQQRSPVFVRPVRKSDKAMTAPIERRNAIYIALPDLLPLNGKHADHLMYERALSDVTIAKNLYASIPESLSEVLEVSRTLSCRYDLAGVPRFFKDG